MAKSLTVKKQERIRKKIKKIRDYLAYERKTFGGYDDSGGSRYVPPGLFIEIEDYKSALTYLRWFWKNFPDDCAYANFHLECAIIYFMNAKLREAENMIIKSVLSNIHSVNCFFGLPPVEISEHLKKIWEFQYRSENIIYHNTEDRFVAFSEWLTDFKNKSTYSHLINELISLRTALEAENNVLKRGIYIAQINNLNNWKF